jgi:hypothetical protein
MFRTFFDRFRGATGLAARQLAPLSAHDRDSIAAELLDEPLAGLGLTRTAPRRWVDGRTPPVRPMVELRLLKSTSTYLAWGFSLDFVPRASAGKLQWHRTNGSADLDVLISPRDLPDVPPFYGSDAFRSDLANVCAAALPRIAADLYRGHDDARLLGFAEDASENRSPWDHVGDSTPYMEIAAIVLRARVSGAEAVDQRLRRWLAQHELHPLEAEKLERHLREQAARAD